jgi:hypothetical protein
VTTPWLDWTFFLVVLFPVPLCLAASAVRAIWKNTGHGSPAGRILCRAGSVVLAALCATGTLTSFVAWWVGFEYIESPAGVPVRLDRAVDVGWVVGMAALAAVLALAAGCLVGHRLRTVGPHR